MVTAPNLPSPRPLPAWGWGVLGLTFTIAIWEGLAQAHIVSPGSLPTFSATATRFIEFLGDPEFFDFLGHSLIAWTFGLFAATLIAIPGGIFIGLSATAFNFVRVVIESIRPVPPIVLLPLALLIIGGGVLYQTTLIVQGAMWPLLITTSYAIRNVDPVVSDTARAFRLTSFQTLFFVRIPAALPELATGLKLAAATAFAVTVVSEILGGAKGIGTQLMIAGSGGDTITVYAVTIVAGVVGLTISFIFGALEKRFLAWKISA